MYIVYACLLLHTTIGMRIKLSVEFTGPSITNAALVLKPHQLHWGTQEMAQIHVTVSEPHTSNTTMHREHDKYTFNFTCTWTINELHVYFRPCLVYNDKLHLQCIYLCCAH